MNETVLGLVCTRSLSQRLCMHWWTCLILSRREWRGLKCWRRRSQMEFSAFQTEKWANWIKRNFAKRKRDEHSSIEHLAAGKRPQNELSIAKWIHERTWRSLRGQFSHFAYSTRFRSLSCLPWIVALSYCFDLGPSLYAGELNLLARILNNALSSVY